MPDTDDLRNQLADALAVASLWDSELAVDAVLPLLVAERERADAAEVRVRQLEDACLVLWCEMPIPEVQQLRDEAPALVDFLAHLHHFIEHEQAMVRRNVWAGPR